MATGAVRLTGGGAMPRICSEDHVGNLPAEFERLPESQASRWRHICAGCAYDLGRRHAEEAEGRLRERRGAS